MNFLKSTLHASLFAALSLLGAEKALAQSYSVLNVTTEGPVADANCSHINNNGTVACTERDNLSPFVFQERITFDNPFVTSAGRDVPAITSFPLNQTIFIQGYSMGSVVVGQLYESRLPFSVRTPFAVSHSAAITIDAAAVYPTPTTTQRLTNAPSINDQGWMLLGGERPTGPVNYLRIPSSSGLSSGTSYLISCPAPSTSGLILKVNRNGLIAGHCRIGANKEMAVVWGWWDLNNPVDLYSFLPTSVDLGSGLIPTTSTTFGYCSPIDMADNADILLIECLTEARDVHAQFVIAASGSRQLDRAITWTDVNAQGCVIGTRYGRDAFLDCGSGQGYRQLSELDGVGKGAAITVAYDINDQGHILAYSRTRGYVVLAPR